MNYSILPGLGGKSLPQPGGAVTEFVVLRQALHRVLAFTRRSIDDVINDPIARNEVIGYYKLYRWIQRESEISELERQWG